jgi:hypothetical protein
VDELDEKEGKVRRERVSCCEAAESEMGCGRESIRKEDQFQVDYSRASSGGSAIRKRNRAIPVSTALPSRPRRVARKHLINDIGWARTTYATNRLDEVEKVEGERQAERCEREGEGVD